MIHGSNRMPTSRYPEDALVLAVAMGVHPDRALQVVAALYELGWWLVER